MLIELDLYTVNIYFRAPYWHQNIQQYLSQLTDRFASLLLVLPLCPGYLISRSTVADILL